MIPLLWGTKIAKIIETENRMVVPGTGGREGQNRKFLFNEHRVSVLRDEKNFVDPWWWWYIIIRMYLLILNCALENGQHGKFYIMYILSLFLKCSHKNE